ncbi:MAG: NUDIX hydrolase [Desulfurococcaceae archaeon]
MERKYPKYAIAAVSSVLIRNNEILLVKRRFPPGTGKWSIPGGVIEAGEKIVEAAKRELLEETGLEADPAGIIWVLNNVVYDVGKRVLYHYVIIDILFDSNTIRGVLRPGGDAVDVAWFRIDELPHLPGVSRTVLKLINRVKFYGLTPIPVENIDLETIEHNT